MRSALEGERKQVTVLFVDVQGSVAMSERVNPEVWHRIMDQFFGLLSDGIHAHEGTINQYTGDGIMALFGAPIAHEDHGRRACLAALHLQSELRRWSAELLQEYNIEFQVRMGLNSGEVVVGSIGDDLRMDYTARGHTVGLAARMEAMAKPGRIYLSQFTAALIKREFELTERGDVRIKGVSHRVKILELRRAMPRGLSRFKTAGERLVPLVGRNEELAELEAALERARLGRGQIVTVTAAPGMGKSRLCYEFAERCRERQIPVYEARGIAHFRAAPLAPFNDFVRSYFGLQETDDEAAQREKIRIRLHSLDAKLAAYTDTMLELSRPDAGTIAGPEFEARQNQILQISQRLILAGAMNETAAVIIENMQWIDDEPQIHAFIELIVRAIAGSQALVVMTMRPEYVPSWPDQSHITAIELQGLADREALTLLDEMMGEDESLSSLKQMIIQKSDGNPLFMEELLGSLLDEGKLERTRGGVRLKGKIEDLTLPAEVQSVVAARLDRLSDEDKRVLQIAAVIGKRFSSTLLRSVAGMPPADFRACLQRLHETGWIYQSRRQGRQEYAFHQSLVREVTYHTQLASNRNLLHRKVAEHLWKKKRVDDGAGMSLVAHHYSQAGDLMEAAGWEARAAEWYGLKDIESAMHRWYRVLALTEEIEESAERCRLLLQAHSRLLHLGAQHAMEPKQADTLMAAGAIVAERCDDAILHAYFLLACGAALQTRGDLKQGLEKLEQAESMASDIDDIGVRAAIRSGRVYCQLNLGLIRQAEEGAAEGLDWLDEDVQAGRGLLGRSPYIALLLYRAIARVYQGDFRQAREMAADGLARATESDESLLMSLALIVQSLVAGEQGHPRKAVAYARQAGELCDETGNRVLYFSSLLAQARACWLSGTLSRGREILEQGLAALQGQSVGLHEAPRYQLCLVQIHLQSAEYDKARGCMREALKLSRRHGSQMLEAEAHLAAAEILVAARGINAANEARDALRRARKLIDQTEAVYLLPRWHLAQADLAEMRSDAQVMQQALDAAIEWLEEAGARLRVKNILSRQAEDKSGKLDNAE